MKVLRLVFLLVYMFYSHSGQSQQLREWFVDTTDNALDVSNFLATRAGFLPVPTLITEPATGYGLGLGLVFFHRSKEEKETGVYLPFPKGLSVAGGVVTQNGTWASFIAHQGSWFKDKVRYLGFVGYVDVNLTYYSYVQLIQREVSVDFNISGIPFYQEMTFRISETNFFLGGEYVYFSNDARLKWESLIFPEGISETYKTGGAGIQAVWDSRDNIFTTNKGIRSEQNFMHFAPYFGGDNFYNTFQSRNIGYFPIGSKIVLGGKVEGKFSFGDIPFYAQPYVTLRGVPVMRYQDEMAFVADTDFRYNIFRRWSFIGFVGAGTAISYENWQENINMKYSAGAGFRYFLSRMYNMHAGVDLARGPEDWAWYIVVGSYWGR